MPVNGALCRWVTSLPAATAGSITQAHLLQGWTTEMGQFRNRLFVRTILLGRFKSVHCRKWIRFSDLTWAKQFWKCKKCYALIYHSCQLFIFKVILSPKRCQCIVQAPLISVGYGSIILLLFSWSEHIVVACFSTLYRKVVIVGFLATRGQWYKQKQSTLNRQQVKWLKRNNNENLVRLVSISCFCYSVTRQDSLLKTIFITQGSRNKRHCSHSR